LLRVVATAFLLGVQARGLDDVLDEQSRAEIELLELARRQKIRSSRSASSSVVLRLRPGRARGVVRLEMFISESSIQQRNDDGSVSSLEDAIEIQQSPAPSIQGGSMLVTKDPGTGRTLCGWRKTDALGAALVVLRRARGVRDVTKVLLGFLERPVPLVLSLASHSHGFYFTANLPDGTCWSCRKTGLEGYEDVSMTIVEDYDIPSCDGNEDVITSPCLCLDHRGSFELPERSDECKAGYVNIVPELVRMTRLWRAEMARRYQTAKENMDENAMADISYVKYLHCDGGGCESDFFQVLEDLHLSSLQDLQAAGWFYYEREWRCNSGVAYEPLH